MIHHMRVLEPRPGIIAFYDGRLEGVRFAPGPNWVDDGALSLGIASYAIVDSGEALVYDTHVTLEHAAFIRETLSARGVHKLTVVLSHWHLDHVAGNEVFSDCEIIANERTAMHLGKLRPEIEAGTLDGPPAISPLVLPSRTFASRLSLRIGKTDVELIAADIHSDDATVVWLPDSGVLLAGDTMEDTVTYVMEPGGFERHVAELDRLWALSPEVILPNHGSADRIERGGYPKGLIRATQQYIRALIRSRSEPKVRDLALKELIAGPLEAGWLTYFQAYEAVHRRNLLLAAGTAALPQSAG